MALSSVELARARQLAGDLLDDLQLRNYVFEIEPAEEQWQLRLGCSLGDHWLDIRMPVERERLLRSDRDPETRRALLEEWRQRLH